ncbi:MAG: Redoxin domain protein [Cryptosporangiaceae bacterium]|jgi:peroxiredoxin|nr:Redoxin domain protein [Cryptosporangiaceae bacterium]
MRRLVAGLAVLLALAGCGVGKDPVDPSPGGDNRFVSSTLVREYKPADRLPAPRIQGDAVTGPRVDSGAYNGTVLVVNFWGSWCAPCRSEAQTLEDIYATSKDLGVQFVGVNIRDAKDRAAAFERAYGITYPSVYDSAGRVALGFRRTPPVGTPATVLVDRQGRVAAVYSREVRYGELKAAVDALAAER